MHARTHTRTQAQRSKSFKFHMLRIVKCKNRSQKYSYLAVSIKKKINTQMHTHTHPHTLTYTNPACKQKHLPSVSLELFETKPIFVVHVWTQPALLPLCVRVPPQLSQTSTACTGRVPDPPTHTYTHTRTYLSTKHWPSKWGHVIGFKICSQSFTALKACSWPESGLWTRQRHSTLIYSFHPIHSLAVF